MHGRTVVPYDKVTDPPVVRVVEFGFGQVRIQPDKLPFTDLRFSIDDVLGQVWADVERFSTRVRMRDDDGMIDDFRRVLLFLSLIHI